MKWLIDISMHSIQTCILFVNMPHSDFKMKNNNKVFVPLLFFTVYKLCYCVMHIHFITFFFMSANCCHIDMFSTSPVIPLCILTVTTFYSGTCFSLNMNNAIYLRCCHNASKF